MMLIDDIKNGENDRLEFKEVPNRDSAKWLKTVVAFANGRGGRIVFGVTNDRRVIGLKGDLFAMKDAIADAGVSALCQRMYQVALDNARSEAERRIVKPVKVAQLAKWGILKPVGKTYDATNAYALLAGSDLFAPVVKCAVFKGVTRSIFIDRREFSGPVDDQIEEAYKYVLSKINLGAVFGEGVRRKDVYEIPPSAIREMIVNAVAHRNYVNGEESPITVALYDDRLDVTSLGKLPYGVTVRKMFEGCSECRNKALAQALAYMNIIEDWGSGIPRIIDDVRKSGLRDLEILT